MVCIMNRWRCDYTAVDVGVYEENDVRLINCRKPDGAAIHHIDLESVCLGSGQMVRYPSKIALKNFYESRADVEGLDDLADLVKAMQIAFGTADINNTIEFTDFLNGRGCSAVFLNGEGSFLNLPGQLINGFCDLDTVVFPLSVKLLISHER